MIDYEVEIKNILEDTLPSLEGKIYPGAVPPKTLPPYAAYTTPSEESVNTKDGVVGYNISFDIALIHTSYAELKEMKQAVVEALNNQLFDEQRCRYKVGEKKYFEEYKLHGYLLTFNIK